MLECEICSKIHYYLLDCVPQEKTVDTLSNVFFNIHHDKKIKDNDAKLMMLAKSLYTYPKNIWLPVLQKAEEILK